MSEKPPETPNQLIERLRIKYAEALRLLEEQEWVSETGTALDITLEVMTQSKQEYTVENFVKTAERVQQEQQKILDAKSPIVLKQLNEEIKKYIRTLN